MIGYQPLRCYLKERDLYGWKCQDARAKVFELNVLVAHFDDHFVEKSLFIVVACVRGSEKEKNEN